MSKRRRKKRDSMVEHFLLDMPTTPMNSPFFNFVMDLFEVARFSFSAFRFCEIIHDLLRFVIVRFLQQGES